MISPETYAALLRIMSPILAVMFWAVTVALWIEAKRNEQLRRRIGSIGWAGHVALYWTVQVVVRYLLGYSTPTVYMSLWVLIIFVHAGVSLLWMAWILWHYGVPPPLTLPEIWRREESGDNDV